MTTTEPDAAPAPRRVSARRAWMAGIAVGVVAADLGAKAWAEAFLTGDGVRLGPLWLHLSYNPGAAFGLGADGPVWLVAGVAALVVAGAGIYAWRVGPVAGGLTRAALAVLFGGGLANLVDRIGDRVVTDYLDLGWWPSFNLADAALCIAVTVLVLTSLRPADGGSHGAKR